MNSSLISFVLLVVLSTLSSAQAKADIDQVVKQAFSSFPLVTNDNLVQAEDLRDFLDHLRGQQTAWVDEPKHARDVHVNKLLHAVREAEGVEMEGDLSLETIIAACKAAAEGFQKHAVAEWEEGASACDGLPDDILARAGSCELKRIRYKLQQGRETVPLFDTERWVRNFEKGLQMMWEVHESGEDPMAVVVNPV